MNTDDLSQARVLKLDNLAMRDIEIGSSEVVDCAILVIKTMSMTEKGTFTKMVVRMGGNSDFITVRGMVERLLDHVSKTAPPMEADS